MSVNPCSAEPGYALSLQIWLCSADPDQLASELVCIVFLSCNSPFCGYDFQFLVQKAVLSITKTRLFKYIENLTTKNNKFQVKNF